VKIAVYTAFAMNYLAKARVLVASLKQCNPDIDVIAIVCDRLSSRIDVVNEQFDQIWMVEDYPATPIKAWIFRHNVMELSTAVKGWGLIRLLDAGYDYVMYIDPDCWVLEDPAKIVGFLPGGFSVGVVAHTTRPADSDEEIRIVETSSLRHGIYNLGFLLVRNDANSRRLAKWWAARLDKYCVNDFAAGLFTDQRWFDLALGYFDFIKVIRHWGIDVASWNVGQRILTRNGEGYLVDSDELIFYHFSGVGPTSVHRWVREKFAPSDPLAAELEFRYENLIAAYGQAEVENIIPYFDLYSDGLKVSADHRALYRSRPDFSQRYEDPYDVSSSPNFREETAVSGSTPLVGVVPIDLGDVETLARRLFEPDFYKRGRGAPEMNDDYVWAKYKKRGWNPGVLGNRFFDTTYYRLFVSEADQVGYPTPLHHYVAVGINGGLSPNWIYNDAYYLGAYPDVREAIRRGEFVCGFHHFSQHGAREGRDGCEYFNERAYLMRHPDVAAAVTDGTLRSGEAHFILHGHREGRSLR
jgi:hypothetical protein